MQRTGRAGHAQFRVIVQDSHFHPTRGRVVAYLGSYNPHSKTTQIDAELASKYLSNGAQPSDRVAKLLQAEGVKLPDWVKLSDPKQRSIRNPEKLRRNQPKEAAAPEVPAEETEAPVAESEAPVQENPAEVESTEVSPEAEVPAEDAPAETAETPETAEAESPESAETEAPAK